MTTEWIRKHVKPSLVAKYEREMSLLRGEFSNKENVIENIKKLNQEKEQIETDEERHARDLAEDAIQQEYFKKNK